jgi:hypothetical protein
MLGGNKQHDNKFLVWISPGIYRPTTMVLLQEVVNLLIVSRLWRGLEHFAVTSKFEWKTKCAGTKRKWTCSLKRCGMYLMRPRVGSGDRRSARGGPNSSAFCRCRSGHRRQAQHSHKGYQGHQGRGKNDTSGASGPDADCS